MSTTIRAAVLALLLVPSLAYGGHHTVAFTYDVSQVVTLKGVITEITWGFPHIVLHLDVPNRNGGVDPWEVETVNPQGARLAGLAQEAIRPGDMVTVSGYVAKDGSHRAATESLTIADGRTVRVSIRGTTPAAQ